MKQIFLFAFTLAAISMGLTGCNFSPGALMGDVNDDPWEWNSSSNYDYNYGTRYSSACNPRVIQETNTNRGTCTVPGWLGNRVAKITGLEDRLEIELRKDSADDNFQITSLAAMRESTSGYSRYAQEAANCTEDKNEARTFSQRFVCTVPKANGYTTDRFHSMTITNTKCGSYTSYTLPSFCSSYESYTVKYGSEYFPAF